MLRLPDCTAGQWKRPFALLFEIFARNQNWGGNGWSKVAKSCVSFGDENNKHPTLVCLKAGVHQGIDRWGAAAVDAPVSGGTPAAEQATLTFMVGGPNAQAFITPKTSENAFQPGFSCWCRCSLWTIQARTCISSCECYPSTHGKKGGQVTEQIAQITKGSCWVGRALWRCWHGSGWKILGGSRTKQKIRKTSCFIGYFCLLERMLVHFWEKKRKKNRELLSKAFPKKASCAFRLPGRQALQQPGAGHHDGCGVWGPCFGRSTGPWSEEVGGDPQHQFWKAVSWKIGNLWESVVFLWLLKLLQRFFEVLQDSNRPPMKVIGAGAARSTIPVLEWWRERSPQVSARMAPFHEDTPKSLLKGSIFGGYHEAPKSVPGTIIILTNSLLCCHTEVPAARGYSGGFTCDLMLKAPGWSWYDWKKEEIPSRYRQQNTKKLQKDHKRFKKNKNKNTQTTNPEAYTNATVGSLQFWRIWVWPLALLCPRSLNWAFPWEAGWKPVEICGCKRCVFLGFADAFASQKILVDSVCCCF